jgi:hypothetical protein
MIDNTIAPIQPPKLPLALILIVGPSGTGKSTALRNLPQDITRIIDAERKGMPFRVTNPNTVVPSNTRDTLLSEIRKAARDPLVQIIGIDSVTAAIDQLQVHCEKTYKGFDIWKNYNDGIQDLFMELKATKKTIVMTSLEEVVQIQGLDGGITTRRRAFVQGKEWANKGIESECISVWSSFAKRDKQSGKIEYFLGTQTDGVTLGKTPPFWNLPETMPNDVWAALQLAGKNI